MVARESFLEEIKALGTHIAKPIKLCASNDILVGAYQSSSGEAEVIDLKVGVAVHACNPGIQVSEAGKLQV